MSANWADVGEWLKSNAGTGAALVGSLLTGNVPAAVAAGVSLVGSATGHVDAAKALAALQQDSTTVVRLQELANQEQASIRDHVALMERQRLEDEQKAHAEGQRTIREGDKTEDSFVRRTRPAMAWSSLLAGIAYVFVHDAPDWALLLLFLSPAWAYMGLRGADKITAMLAQRGQGK